MKFDKSEKSWIFLDFDNTMMATEHLAVPSLVDRFNTLYGDRIGRKLTVDEFQQNFKGQARQSLADNLSRHFDIDVDYELLYHDRELYMMRLLKSHGVEMAPGLVDSLEYLKKSGIRLAFVSNNPIQRAFAAMRAASNGQGKRLAAVFEANFFEAGETQKPRPDVYLRALELLGVEAEHCLAIEDSVTGVKAAVGAGIDTLGCTAFDGGGERLIEHGALATFSDFAELRSFFDKN